MLNCQPIRTLCVFRCSLVHRRTTTILKSRAQTTIQITMTPTCHVVSIFSSSTTCQPNFVTASLCQNRVSFFYRDLYPCTGPHIVKPEYETNFANLRLKH